MKKKIGQKSPKTDTVTKGGMQGRESPVKASKYFVVVETPVPKFYEGFLSQPLKWVKKKGMKALNFKNSVLMRKFITHV